MKATSPILATRPNKNRFSINRFVFPSEGAGITSYPTTPLKSISITAGFPSMFGTSACLERVKEHKGLYEEPKRP